MGFNFNVQDAVREKIYPKIGIFSPSGGGKTYTSLRLATGMVEEMKRSDGKDYEIWLANNEGDRGKYYANEFDYKIIELSPPHEPEMYIELINFAEKNEKCGVLIIDSFTKEWAGEGGCLDIAQKLGGQYQKAWKNVTPRHRALMDKLVESKLIIIATMRGEDQYVMSQDEKSNKTNLEKIGLGAKQGKDFEYEFTCTLSLEQKTNSAESFKDNTHLFENMPSRKLTEDDGVKIIKWANESSIEPLKHNKPVFKDTKNTNSDELKSIVTLIDTIAKTKAKTNRDGVAKAITTHHNSANYNSIEDVEVAKKVLESLQELQ